MLLWMLIVLSSAHADWLRTMSTTPISNHRNFFIATYLHRGLIDYSIPSSQFLVYMTIGYDLLQPCSILYSKLSLTEKQSRVDHEEVKEWMIYKYNMKNKPTVTKQKECLHSPITLPDEDEIESILIEESSLSQDEKRAKDTP
jgi:hypothetical protein